MTMLYKHISSPLGEIVLLADETHVLQISMTWDTQSRYSKRIAKATKLAPSNWIEGENALIKSVEKQLHEYFEGRRTTFDFPLRMIGTDFQKHVWQTLLSIPFGQTRTYQEIATAMGMPSAVRAVANANGANALPIVVPCHRVIGSNGRLTGFSGGLDKKEKLLAVENLCFPR